MFGMGTGGSLRLLSPETKRGLDPFAAALLDSVSRHSNCLLTCHPFALASAFLQTSDRPSNGLPTSSLGLLLAAPGFAPSKPHRPEFLSLSDQDFDFHSSHSLTNFLWFQFQVSVLGPASHSRTQLFLILSPYSLIPLSKIKPSTD